jgi:hypothetical protein
LNTYDFDLTPDPRVLQMLGEINLDQWKCIAELVDNSVDSFIDARRRGSAISSPEVVVTLPTQDREDASVVVRDNGPGMTIEQLERAVRAGWSGNNPLDSLGLFGMGFNIATARLGLVTEVYTTRLGDLEWSGLRIDLNELRRTRSYHTPRQVRPKPNPAVHGTEIRILRLKPDQRAYFARGANQQKIRKQLSRVYSPLLLSPTESFSLQLNNQLVQGRRPCYWNPERSLPASDGLTVHAVEPFDFKLPARMHCLTCMTTFPVGQNCPTATPECKLVEISRRLHGWVGLQRYLHEEDFGIDLVRNGRVIEPQNKDLFIWTGGERPEREYPIDDQRNRGRFIGEIHIDHCRVSYTKDRFERDDAAWAEMVALVRGEGPLRPEKARAMGIAPQQAPLYRLFQAYRRSSPQGKTGRWSRILVVKNHERAIEMADLFLRGDPEYQTDEKWFALVEEEDRRLVGGETPGGASAPPAPAPPEGFIDEGTGTSTAAEPLADDSNIVPARPQQQLPLRQKRHELSRTYKHPLLKVEFNVETFSVEPGDPDVPPKAPWSIKMDDPGTRTFNFLFLPEHQVFRSMTMTPLDALLTELALKAYEFIKDTMPGSAMFASILADLREQYTDETKLEAQMVIGMAHAALREISMLLVGMPPDKCQALFAALASEVQEHVRRKVAASGASSIQNVVACGEFLLYASPAAVRQFVMVQPQLFFDGNFWDQPYSAIEYGSDAVNAEARTSILQRYDAYLADAAWLASQSPRDLDRCDRDAVMRAMLSARLLSPDGER